jgi:heme/copper-type cytochrome/quinol oxidase subunit 2
MEKYIIALFLLFLIISTNFIGSLFPCDVQKMFRENYYLKYIIAFMILLFVVELDNKINNPEKQFSEIFMNTVIVFVGFVLITFLDARFFFAIVIAMLFTYVLTVHRDRLTDDNLEYKESINSTVNFMFYVIGAILVIGLIVSVRNRTFYKKCEHIEHKIIEHKTLTK